jgi:hypothetical protein
MPIPTPFRKNARREESQTEGLKRIGRQKRVDAQNAPGDSTPFQADARLSLGANAALKRRMVEIDTFIM